MFSGCPSVCACVRPSVPELAVDLEFYHSSVRIASTALLKLPVAVYCYTDVVTWRGLLDTIVAQGTTY